MSKKHTIDYIKEKFQNLNLEYLYDFYNHAHFNHNCKCLKCHYIWKVRYNHIQKGHGCPRCGKNLKSTLEEIKNLCLFKNLEFLDHNYKTSHSIHNIKCLKCHYIWEGKITRIREGNGCPKCHRSVKYTLEYIREFCKNVELKFLDNDYKNNGFKHNIKCLKCDYVWKLKFNSIKNGTTCPNCTSSKKYTLERVKKFFEKNKLELLENSYRNGRIPLLTLCKKCNMEWKICLGSVIQGSGCPECCKNKNEKLTGETLRAIFPNKEIKSKEFKVKIYNNHGELIRNKIKVDYYFILYNKEYILEYNGEQHYKPTRFGNRTVEITEKLFKNQQTRDEFLRNYCKENKID